MRLKTIVPVLLCSCALVLLSSGCEQLGLTTTPNAANTSSSPAQPQNPTAVESAIALSDKYAKLSEEASALRQQNQALENEKRKLTDDLQSCRNQLEKTQKDLSEVNDLLVKTQLELNNWKNDVLGFRDEMRDAEKAQLEALLKILKLLGGEPKTETTQPQEEQK